MVERHPPEGPQDPSQPDAPAAARPRATGGAAPGHNQADQFSKSLLRDALSHASAPLPETEVEVMAATQKIDVYAVPDPARAAERERMGLLGELSREPTLFEPFRGTPHLPPIRRVLCKQLTWHHELERRARLAARVTPRLDPDTEEEQESAAPDLVPFPWLVVISHGHPETVITLFGFKPVSPGVYEAVPGLRMRVVVLTELPRARETLLLRLLGKGRRLAEALADLRALPEEAWERSLAMPLLVHFKLARQSTLDTSAEDEVSAEIRALFRDYEQKLRAEARDEGRNEGRNEGRSEGRAAEAARAVLTALRVRGIAVPDVVRERILAERDVLRLERWHERAIVATSAAEVIDDPS